MTMRTTLPSLAIIATGLMLGADPLGMSWAQERGLERPADLVFGAKQTVEHKQKTLTAPSLHVDDQGLVAAAWMEEEKGVRSVMFARSVEPSGPLGAPVRVNRPEEAPYWRQEAPALALAGEYVYVTWAMADPRATPDKPFSSLLRLSRSVDGGRTFLPSIPVNDDDVVGSHTFDSLAVGPTGVLHLAWIDPRDGEKEKDTATFATVSKNHGQSVEPNRKVDGGTCVCCRTAVTTAPDGTVYLAWRKVFDGNVRETVVARSTDGGLSFSEPIVVGHDRWVFPGCPHRPASLGVDRWGRLYVVWYTEGADETPAVYLAYSDDGARTFSNKVKLNVSKGTFPDHPQMAVDPDGRLVVVWEEQSPVRREIVMRVSLDRGATFSAPRKLNEKKGQGPAVAVNGKGLVALAWLEHAMPGHRLVFQTMQLPAVSLAGVH